MDYRQAGVDVEAGRAFVQQIRRVVEKTYRPEVMGGLGGFSGLFALPTGYQEPILVAGTDGVGTKLKLANLWQQHHAVGIDLVAMCVNDVLTCGAEPLFFLDYLATGHLEPTALSEVVGGISAGCQQANCALLGGETAEMPGFYAPGEYDLAGFCVGIVEKSRILDGQRVTIGDGVIGLASQGVHSNGFSLVRQILSLVAQQQFPDTEPAAAMKLVLAERPHLLQGQSLAENLLTPTQIYVKPVLAALAAGLEIHGMAHITGGGLPENLPRCLGVGQTIAIDSQSWPAPPIFVWLAEQGQVTPSEMFHTFNMGIGLGLVVAATETNATVQFFQQQGIAAWQIGQVIPGEGGITGLPIAP